MQLLQFFIVFFTFSNYVRSSPHPTLSFQLVGGDRHCPRDAGKKVFLLGWRDRSCSQLASVGPQLLANRSSFEYRSWTVEPVTRRVVRLVTHPPSIGNMLCPGGSLAVANLRSCRDSRVTISPSPVTDLSDHFVMVRVPKNVRTSFEEVYLVAVARGRGCARLLSANIGCFHSLLKLVTRDDGSGLQRWIRSKVAIAPSPPTPIPTPLVPSPSPVVPSPSPLAPSPSPLVPSPSPLVPSPSPVPLPTCSGRGDICPPRGDLSCCAGLVCSLITGYGYFCTDVSHSPPPPPSPPPPSPPPPSPPPPSPPPPSPPPLGDMFTFAGTGSSQSSGDGGLATNAGMYPYNVAFDSIGNVYITDHSNNRIRKVDYPNNTISTFAGNGSHVYLNDGDGGPATSASLHGPRSVAINPVTGDFYIADTQNFRVRMVNASTKIITTVAGNGSGVHGGDGQPATNASLNGPFGMAFDNVGNMYVVEAYANRVRMVNASTKIITTVVGNGSNVFGGDGQHATSAAINNPYAIAFDTNGNMYIADYNNNRVRMVNASTQIITTFAGNGTESFGGDGQPATSASLFAPSALAFDSAGNLYICDSNHSRIRMVNASTQIITTVAGNGTHSFGGDGQHATSASLNYPQGVSVNTVSGNIYISDTYNHRVRIVYA